MIIAMNRNILTATTEKSTKNGRGCSNDSFSAQRYATQKKKKGHSNLKISSQASSTQIGPNEGVYNSKFQLFDQQSQDSSIKTCEMASMKNSRVKVAKIKDVLRPETHLRVKLSRGRRNQQSVNQTADQVAKDPYNTSQLMVSSYQTPQTQTRVIKSSQVGLRNVSKHQLNSHKPLSRQHTIGLQVHSQKQHVKSKDRLNQAKEHLSNSLVWDSQVQIQDEEMLGIQPQMLKGQRLTASYADISLPQELTRQTSKMHTPQSEDFLMIPKPGVTGVPKVGLETLSESATGGAHTITEQQSTSTDQQKKPKKQVNACKQRPQSSVQTGFRNSYLRKKFATNARNTQESNYDVGYQQAFDTASTPLNIPIPKQVRQGLGARKQSQTSSMMRLREQSSSMERLRNLSTENVTTNEYVSMRDCLQISPARIQQMSAELVTSNDQSSHQIKTMLLQSENRPPAYFIFNRQMDRSSSRLSRPGQSSSTPSPRIHQSSSRLTQLDSSEFDVVQNRRNKKRSNRDGIGFFFEPALKPDIHGNYTSGHADNEHQVAMKRKKELSRHKQLMKKTDCREDYDYYRSKLDTIQVTGECRVKAGNRKALKQQEKALQQAYMPQERLSGVQSKQFSSIDSDSRQHQHFLKLMNYMNEYKQNICYDTSSLINVNPRRHHDDDDIIEQQRQEKLSSENIFPTAKVGPNKGKYIPMRDERGNVVVDPTTTIKKDPFFIDFHLFNRYNKLAQKGKVVHLAKQITKKERSEIKELFAPYKSLIPKEKTLTELQKFTAKKSITSKILGSNQREGQAAGTRDTKIVGPVRKRISKTRSSLPKFTPEQAGHYYGMKRTVEDQKAKADKFVRKGTLKTASFLQTFHKDDNPMNPVLMDVQKQKEFLHEEQDMKFMSSYYPTAVKKLINELNVYSEELVATDKTKQHRIQQKLNADDHKINSFLDDSYFFEQPGYTDSKDKKKEKGESESMTVTETESQSQQPMSHRFDQREVKITENAYCEQDKTQQKSKKRPSTSVKYGRSSAAKDNFQSSQLSTNKSQESIDLGRSQFIKSANRTRNSYKRAASATCSGPQIIAKRKQELRKDKQALQKIYSMCKEEMSEIEDASFDLLELDLGYQIGLEAVEDAYQHAKMDSIKSQLIMRTQKTLLSKSALGGTNNSISQINSSQKVD